MAFFKTKHFDEYTNNVERRWYLDLIDEKRWASKVIQGRMSLTTTRYFNGRVSALHILGGWGDYFKAVQTWEGLYKIIKIVTPRSYYLKNLEGVKLLRSFNELHKNITHNCKGQNPSSKQWKKMTWATGWIKSHCSPIQAINAKDENGLVDYQIIVPPSHALNQTKTCNKTVEKKMID